MKRFLFLLLLLLLPSLSEAGTYWVSQSGSNGNACTNTITPQTTGAKLTVAAGLACLTSPGDTLYIRAGTYHERILYTQLIPSGTAGNPVTISAYSGETVWLDGSTATNVPLINLANNGGPNSDLRYIVFNGINLDCLHVSGGDGCVGTSPGGHVGVVEHITWQNYEAKNNNSTNGAPGGFAPVHIINGNFHTFRNCVVHDSGLTPVPVDNFGGYAFYINGDDHVVDHCTLYNLGGYGIQIFKLDDSVTGSSRVTVSNTRIHHTGLNSIGQTTGGLIIGSGTGHKVFNNEIVDGYDGIEVSYSCTDCIVANNTIYNSKSRGISLGITTRPVITNNIIVNSGTQNGEPHIADDSGGGASPSYNTNLCSGSGATTHCAVTQNPLFVNPSALDFRLQSGSAAINAGTNLGSTYSPDLAGVARPTSGPWEIGAFEFGFACPSTAPLLVGAYSFDNTANDLSGSGPPAILGPGVTYTPSGKYNQGLTFTGAGGVTVADRNSLDFCNGFTLEAWVNVPSISSDSMFIVKNPNSTYFLGNLSGFVPLQFLPAGGFGGSSSAIAFHGLQLTPSTLTHLAVTYDGATVSLYKNGVPVSTATGGAIINATTGTLQFCDSGFGELCPSGTVLDEVRLYNYPRTPAQILTDMNTPITPTPNIVLQLSSTNLKIGPGVTLKFGVP